MQEAKRRVLERNEKSKERSGERDAGKELENYIEQNATIQEAQKEHLKSDR